MAVIQAWAGGRFLNHSSGTGEVVASIEAYVAETGDFDGELWNLVDAGNGNVFIQGASGGRYLNHSFATGEVSASIERFNPATGAYDGTLWRILDAGNGYVFIQGVSGGRYLNHLFATGQVSASIERYDQGTGAFDGTVWRLITACHLKTNAKSGNKVSIRNSTGVPATVQIGQLTVDFSPDSIVSMSPSNSQGGIIEMTSFEVTPFVPLIEVGQVALNTNNPGNGGNSGNALPTYRLKPGGGFGLL